MNTIQMCIIAVFIGFSVAKFKKINVQINTQQTQIEQLTERVHLLENALADKSGIKPEKTK